MNPPLSPRLVALALPLDDFFMGFGAILAYDAGYHPESLDPGVVLAVALTVYERYQRREAATWLGLSLGGAAAVSSAHAGATKACGYLYGLRLARPEPSLAPAELSAGDCARAFRARLRRHRRAMRLGAGAYAGVWSLECALRGNDSGLCLEWALWGALVTCVYLEWAGVQEVGPLARAYNRALRARLVRLAGPLTGSPAWARIRARQRLLYRTMRQGCLNPLRPTCDASLCLVGWLGVGLYAASLFYEALDLFITCGASAPTFYFCGPRSVASAYIQAWTVAVDVGLGGVFYCPSGPDPSPLWGWCCGAAAFVAWWFVAHAFHGVPVTQLTLRLGGRLGGALLGLACLHAAKWALQIAVLRSGAALSGPGGGPALEAGLALAGLNALLAGAAAALTIWAWVQLQAAPYLVTGGLVSAYWVAEPLTSDPTHGSGRIHLWDASLRFFFSGATALCLALVRVGLAPWLA